MLVQNSCIIGNPSYTKNLIFITQPPRYLCLCFLPLCTALFVSFFAPVCVSLVVSVSVYVCPVALFLRQHLARSCHDLIFINSRNGIEWKWTSFLDFFSGIKVSATRLDEYALKNNLLVLYRRVSYFPPSSSFWSTMLLRVVQYLCNQMFRPLETDSKSNHQTTNN